MQDGHVGTRISIRSQANQTQLESTADPRLVGVTELWAPVDRAIADLLQNRDLVETATHSYVIGYTCGVSQFLAAYQESHTGDSSEAIFHRMAASVAFGEALALGLASGPACIAACGPVLVPSLLGTRPGLRPNTGFLFSFLGARLLGYLLFAAVAWELGVLITLPPKLRVLLMGAVNVSLAGVLLWYAYSARHNCGQVRTNSKLVQIESPKDHTAIGAAGLGLLTGLNLCPPFVTAGVRAAELGSVAQALLFFTGFFVGTSAWFLPFAGFSCIARNQGVITVARMAMVLIALYYFSLGIAMLIGRKAYGY